MTINPEIGVGFTTGEAFTTPTSDNENLLLTTSKTPAELMHFIRQEKERLRRKLAADPSLLNDPQVYMQWEEIKAFEACARYQLFHVRQRA